MKYYVYCLFRTGERQPCYVGATCQPKERKMQHHGRYGRAIALIVWETFTTVHEAACREAELIAEFRALGVALDNRKQVRHYPGPDQKLHAQREYERAQQEARQCADRLELSAAFNSPEFTALASRVYLKANIT